MIEINERSVHVIPTYEGYSNDNTLKGLNDNEYPACLLTHGDCTRSKPPALLITFRTT